MLLLVQIILGVLAAFSTGATDIRVSDNQDGCTGGTGVLVIEFAHPLVPGYDCASYASPCYVFVGSDLSVRINPTPAP